MPNTVKCFLRCKKDTHAPIALPHQRIVVLGRCPETKIKEKRCSKTQLTLKADISSLSVHVRQTGPNTSAVNGVALGINRERVAHHGDTVHFLLGQFEHVVEFEPPPNLESIPVLKRQKQHEEHPAPKKICVASPDNSSSSSKHLNHKKWESLKGGKVLFYQSEGVQSSSKVAAYDMDGTLILTKSGKVFPQYPDDWRIMWPEIPSKLQKLHEDGFKIVIFTNQAGISRGKTTVTEIQQKIEKVIGNLGVPAQAYVATSDSIFRKPAPGMWDLLVAEGNEGIGIDMSASLYCGDAAGRPENLTLSKRKKDFSCSDRLFAKNLGIPFYTPEEHFLNKKPMQFNLPDFDPSIMPPSNEPLLDPPNAKIPFPKQELILLVGFPGSGKSFFCREYLIPSGYVHVNRDSLGSWQKCVAATKSALENGKSVAVDNTNPDPESRSRYVEVATKLKVTCRCLIVGESIARARHNNKYREFIGEVHEPISEMVMNAHKSKFKEPQLSEGFQEIFRVNFKPKFSNTQHERLYKMYLLDKY